MTAFLKSTPELELPDIQLLFNAAPITAHAYFPPFVQPYADGFGCRAVLLHPESRGRIELASPEELLLVASTKGHRQVCACSVLKAMHIIHHLDGRELLFTLPLSDQEVFHLVEETMAYSGHPDWRAGK